VVARAASKVVRKKFMLRPLLFLTLTLNSDGHLPKF
jgi:hypothetical protein